nr:hypothetical protein [Tanacetum cinerariifolium]
MTQTDRNQPICHLYLKLSADDLHSLEMADIRISNTYKTLKKSLVYSGVFRVSNFLHLTWKFSSEYGCSSLALDRGKKKVEDEIGSLETRLTYLLVEKNVRQNRDGGGNFGVVLLQTCLTEILGFHEKFGGGFEKDI